MRDLLKDLSPILWPAASAVLVVLLRARTPEQWVALGEQRPRLQGAIRLLRALGVDPVKAIAALSQIVTGRAPARALAVADAIAPKRDS
jgi:hypothetical protein